MASDSLSDKQKQFANYYIGEARFNATKAAELAGYSPKTARSIGSENLTKPDIRAYIDTRLKELTLTGNEVLVRLTQIANGSIEAVLDEEGRFDYEAAQRRGTLHLVKKLKRKTTSKKVERIADEGIDGGVEELETSIVFEEVEFEMYSAHEALRDLGKYHKLFTFSHELTGKDGDPLIPTSADAAAIEKINQIYDRLSGAK